MGYNKNFGKMLFLLVLASLFFFGCTQTGGTQSEKTGGAGPAGNTGAQQEAKGNCQPSYTFSDISNGVLSKNIMLVANVQCANGKTIALYVDGTKLIGQPVESNDAATLTFRIIPKTDETKTVELKADDEVIYSKQVAISPIGSKDTSGNKNDAISAKEWIASSFDIENGITVRRIGAYMKRLYSNTLKDSVVIAELHRDDGGKPASAYLEKTTVPITTPTLTENWIWFKFSNGAELQPGKYWVVFKVDQGPGAIVSDVANIHYTAKDTQTAGNDYTRQMTLEWSDAESKYRETAWQPLPYDRTYAVIVSAVSS